MEKIELSRELKRGEKRLADLERKAAGFKGAAVEFAKLQADALAAAAKAKPTPEAIAASRKAYEEMFGKPAPDHWGAEPEPAKPDAALAAAQARMEAGMRLNKELGDVRARLSEIKARLGCVL